MKLEGPWRFNSPGELDADAVDAFYALAVRISGQGDTKQVLEHFKRHFADAAGRVFYGSTNERFAREDARSYMMEAASNAPLFIEAFWEACQSLGAQGREVPDVDHVNRLLAEHGIAFRVEPPMIVAAEGHQPVGVPTRFESLDETAQQLIHDSFAAAEAMLQGSPRQAVQEVLWLMETVSTAFRGMTIGDEEIVAKYFNKIAVALKRQAKGTVLEQALDWMTTMHGYLSSPTGGGVRHGRDLKDGIVITPNDARLICNLVRSYVSYLMAEHARLTRGMGSAA